MSNQESKPLLTNKDLALSWLGNKGAQIEWEYNQTKEAGAKENELVEFDHRRRSVDREFERVMKNDRQRILRFARNETRRRAEIMAQENNNS